LSGNLGRYFQSWSFQICDKKSTNSIFSFRRFRFQWETRIKLLSEFEIELVDVLAPLDELRL